ncbi:enoyl-CoA hydratase/isomerase family protein [Chloroflexota bacterium]
MSKIKNKPEFNINKLERHSYEKGKIGKNIAKIMFDWPAAANSQDYRAVNELNDILEVVSNDDEVDVVILTGAGKWFSSGAYLRGWEYDYDGVFHDKLDILDKDPEKYMMGERAEVENNLRILRMPQIVIAAINGACIGMVNDIAAACDTRIASEKAFFGLVQIAQGLQSLNGYALFPPIMGLSKAKRFYLKGSLSYPDYMGAKEAKEMGLVDEVLPADQFEDRVNELTRDIASIPRQTTRLIKETFNLPIIASLEESSQRSNLGQVWIRQNNPRFRADHKRAFQTVLDRHKTASQKFQT